jgi:hypothetical protein
MGNSDVMACAVLHGLLIALVIIVTFIVDMRGRGERFSLRVDEVIRVLASLVIPIVFPMILMYRRLFGWGRGIYVAVLAAATVALSEALNLLAAIYGVVLGRSMPFLTRDAVGSVHLPPDRLFFAIVVIASVTFVVLRMILGRVVLQDGTLCPQCAYSVLRVYSRRCPECGREFTFQELGTTEERFRGKRLFEKEIE